MIRIKINDIDVHRVETTFRPYLQPKVLSLFNDIGVEFVFSGGCELIWVCQASRQFRRPYGWWFKEGYKSVYFDGHDSASLYGSWENVKDGRFIKLIKNSLYSDSLHYSTESAFGRIYWGKSENQAENYKLNIIPPFELSGVNWLSTVKPTWYDYRKINKPVDVCALFQWKSTKSNYEYGKRSDHIYDAYRLKFINELKKLRDTTSLNIVMLDGQEKLPIDQYYAYMQHSKVIVAPFGYGEIAPRDLEASMFGSILIKPDMNHISTYPNPYNDETTIFCKWDASDLTEKIEYAISNFNQLQESYVEAFRQSYISQSDPEQLVMHTYQWLKDLPMFC